MSLLLDASAGQFAGATIRKTSETPPCVDVFDLIRAVEPDMNSNYANETWVELKQKPEIANHVHRFRYPEQRKGGWGSWVADARGVVLIVQYLPGPRATEFRVKGADIVVRALGGDETLVAEIRRNAAAQTALPEEHPMRLFGETVEAEKHGRSLDDDEDLHVVRKKRIMTEEERQLAEANQSLVATRIQGWKGLLQGLEGLYAQLSDHAVPGALQNILVCRTNTTNKLLSAAVALVDQASAEHGPTTLAITAAPVPAPAPAQPAAGSMLSRITVLDVGRELRLSAAQLEGNALSKVGMKARNLWFLRGGADLEMTASGGWKRTVYANGTTMPNGFVKWTSESKSIEPEWTSDVLNTHRIKYSSAFADAHELGLSKAHNTWTYPASTGKQMLLQAFKDTGVVQDDAKDLYA